MERIERLVEESLNWWRAHQFGAWSILSLQSDRILGWYGLRPIPDPSEPELFYGLAEDARGKGLATEAGVAVLNHAFNADGVESVWAATTPSIEASIGVMKRLGMTFESNKKLDGVDSVIFRVQRKVSE